MKDINGKSGLSVIMIGYIGLKGTAILAEKHRKEIDERYPLWFSREAVSLGGKADSEAFERAKILLSEHLENNNEGACVAEIAEGGFLTGLYELAGESGKGFEIDLRKVPILQDTVEICELLEVNPYHLYSGYCIVAIVPEAGALVTKMTDEGINAVIVGHTTDKKAHILHNDGTESHLNRPEPDELNRLGLI